MNRSVFIALLVVALLAITSIAHATTRVVYPTGNYPQDRDNIRAAVSASGPGDTVQLASGWFNLTGLQPAPNGDSTLAVIAQRGIRIIGSGGTRLTGPGVYTDYDAGDVVAFHVTGAAAGTDIEAITFEKFEYTIVADGSAGSLTIRDCQFHSDGIALWADSGLDLLRFIHNEVVTPSSAEADPDFFLGGCYLRGIDDLVATDNSFEGPGISKWFLQPQRAIGNAGLWVADKRRTNAPPQSNRGVIARNSVRGFDIGLETTANDIVIESNTASQCGEGIGVGTEFGDLLTTGVQVILNTSQLNLDAGILVAATQGSMFLHNDCRSNEGTGIAFTNGAAPSSIASQNNDVLHNLGPIENRASQGK